MTGRDERPRPNPPKRRRANLAGRRDADPRTIVTTLSEFGVDFVAVGGVAALAHGVQRITRDFDILIEPSTPNRRRAIDALVSLNAEEFQPATKRWIRLHAEASPEWLLREARFFDSDAGAIDVCNAMDGMPDWSTARNGSIEIEAFERSFRVLDKDTLIRSKLASGRNKDLEDITEINELARTERSPQE